MALETLKGIAEIDGVKIVRDKPLNMSWDDFDKLRVEFPINITDRVNCISFKLQDGPIKEVGKNGCQVDSLVAVAKRILIGFNEKVPHKNTTAAIEHLDRALFEFDKRAKDREGRGVEGTHAQ